MELRYWVVLTFLGAIWGSAFIFIKVAAPEFGAIGLVQARLTIASLVFMPILLRKKYLILSKQHHPDLLINKGVPKEVIEESKNKMRAINNAWNQVQKLKKN